MQMIWPAASAGALAIVSVGYLYWVKRRGWGVASKIDKATEDLSKKVPNDVT